MMPGLKQCWWQLIATTLTRWQHKVRVCKIGQLTRRAGSLRLSHGTSVTVTSPHHPTRTATGSLWCLRLAMPLALRGSPIGAPASGPSYMSGRFHLRLRVRLSLLQLTRRQPVPEPIMPSLRPTSGSSNAGLPLTVVGLWHRRLHWRASHLKRQGPRDRHWQGDLDLDSDLGHPSHRGHSSCASGRILPAEARLWASFALQVLLQVLG